MTMLNTDDTQPHVYLRAKKNQKENNTGKGWGDTNFMRPVREQWTRATEMMSHYVTSETQRLRDLSHVASTTRCRCVVF